MQNPINVKFTKEGFEKLKVEHQKLLEKRPQVLTRLVAAREQGDLSENAGYHASKDELAQLDRRVRELKYLMRYGQIISAQLSGMVTVGNTVKVSKANETFEYKIVGLLEADPSQGRLSEASPIGNALIGKKVGDEVEIVIPDGKITYKIIEIK